MFNSSSASAQSFVALVCNTTYLHNSVVRAVQRDYALLNQTSADRAISTQGHSHKYWEKLVSGDDLRLVATRCRMLGAYCCVNIFCNFCQAVQLRRWRVPLAYTQGNFKSESRY